MSLFGTAGALILSFPTQAGAAGFYLQEQSTRGWGRANSGEVADDGPASLWWNPASIGGIEESSSSFGATAILPVAIVTDEGTSIDRPGVAPVPVGGAFALDNPVLKGVLPNSAFALRLGRRAALGLTITSPFSFTTEYDPTGWQRYGAIRTKLLTIDVQPSIGFQATDWLNIGAAVNIEHSDAVLSNALPNLTPGSPDGRLLLKGKGWDLGWSAGLQLRPREGLSIGLSYKSAITHHLEGTVSISGLAGPLAARNLASDVEASFTTPWQLIMGARIAATSRLTLNAQAVHFGWSSFDAIDLGAPLGGAIAQGYKNTWSFAFGVDQKLGERLTLRSGIQFDPTPTRDSMRTPRVPDADRVNYNVGASWRLSKRMQLDAAAAYTDFVAAPIGRDEQFYGGTAAQTDVAVTGRVDNQHGLVFSVGGRLSL